MADARREGVQLLMERSFGDPAWEGDADEEEAPSRGPEEEGEEDAEERELVARAVALSRSLLTPQAEARLLRGQRPQADEGGLSEEERLSLQLFPWHCEVARRFEQATWQLRAALGGHRGGGHGGLAEVARFFDHALGVSQPFDFGGNLEAPRGVPEGSPNPRTSSVSGWRSATDTLGGRESAQTRRSSGGCTSGAPSKARACGA